VAVYHPYNAPEGASVKSVEYFGGTNDFVGITVRSDGRTDYIFNSASGKSAVSHRDMRFEGTYAVVSEKDGAVDYLFLGAGQELKKDKWHIIAKNEATQVSLTCGSNSLEVTASGDIQLTVPADRQPTVSDINQSDKKIQVTAQPNGTFSVQLSDGKYQIKL
jgi:hypothetical protein